MSALRTAFHPQCRTVRQLRVGWPCRSRGWVNVRNVKGKRRILMEEFVANTNKITFCANCGSQPIEWHNPEHKNGKEHQRISNLVQHASCIEEIQSEMNASIPLCRRCHMIEDGRAVLLDGRVVLLASRKRYVVPAKPCSQCRVLAKPTRRGLCSSCYERERSRRRRAKWLPPSSLPAGIPESSPVAGSGSFILHPLALAAMTFHC